jgi:hypothetical protein
MPTIEHKMDSEGWADPQKIPNPDGPRADLPIIELPSGAVPIVESAKKLFELIKPSGKLFVRGGAVMKLGRRQDGMIVLTILSPHEARSLFETFARLVVLRKGANSKQAFQPALCSVDTAKALIASAEAQEILPLVTGLINCPVMSEKDGELCIGGEGYDPTTKRLVTGGGNPLEVDFTTATGALLELMSDFEFQTESDRSRALASLLSPALKMGGFINGPVPADVAEADQSQSGKTYRQKIIAAVYNEQVSIVAKRQGGVGSVDELFSEQLVAGRPFIQFDNFRQKMDSQFLESFMTAEAIFPCRVPYKGSIDVRPEDFFIFMSSNGVETTRDFANRSNIIRIRKKPVGFEFRKYQEGSLLQHVKANQPYYLGCVFSIVRAWHKAGKPKTAESRHAFREWVQVTDWIVQKLFPLAPLMDGHREAQENVSSPDMVFLRAVVLSVIRSNATGEPLSASEIAELCSNEGIQIPGLPTYVVDQEKASRQVGICFGRLFSKQDLIESDGHRVRRELKRVHREDGKGYRDSKAYVVEARGARNQPAEKESIFKNPSEKNVLSFCNPQKARDGV